MPGIEAVQGSAGGAVTVSASAAGLAAALRAASILDRPAFSALANSALATSNTLPRMSCAAYSNALAITGAPEARDTIMISLS